MVGAIPGHRINVVWALMLAASQLTWVGCASTSKAPYVWADDVKELARPEVERDYVIGIGDALYVQVWEQEKMSAHVRVRSDGQVSLPFLNDVPAAGITPVSLARDLEGRLKQFVVTPQVTVAVDDARPLSVSVLGQVGEPGLHNLLSGAGVAQALAAAGGLSDFAKKDRIFVLRANSTAPRIRMTYDAITAGLGNAGKLRLYTGDIVVVE